jgi:hypothetical protein
MLKAAGPGDPLLRQISILTTVIAPMITDSISTQQVICSVPG